MLRLDKATYLSLLFKFILSERLSKSTAQKMKFSIKDFLSKCDQIRRKLRFGHIY